MNWSVNVARMGGRRGACGFMVRKPEGNGPLGRPRLVWENNVNLLAPEFGI